MVHLWAYVCSFILGRTGPVQVSEHGVSSLLLASCRIELRSLALARVPLPAPWRELFDSWPHFIFNSQFHVCLDGLSGSIKSPHLSLPSSSSYIAQHHRRFSISPSCALFFLS